MMNVFDVHVHIFPDGIAERAVSAIGSFYERLRALGRAGTK